MPVVIQLETYFGSYILVACLLFSMPLVLLTARHVTITNVAQHEYTMPLHKICKLKLNISNILSNNIQGVTQPKIASNQSSI
jgi:hypothetical protein